MGTNFYARKKPSPREVIKAHEILDDVLLGNLSSDNLYDYLDNNAITVVHLGKRSCGWQFHWQHQPEYYKANLTSIKNFLRKPEWEIYDEYGEKFSLEKFLEDEIGYCLLSGYTAETYERDHPPTSPLFSGVGREWISLDGLRFSDDDFS